MKNLYKFVLMLSAGFTLSLFGKEFTYKGRKKYK